MSLICDGCLTSQIPFANLLFNRSHSFQKGEAVQDFECVTMTGWSSVGSAREDRVGLGEDSSRGTELVSRRALQASGGIWQASWNGRFTWGSEKGLAVVGRTKRRALSTTLCSPRSLARTDSESNAGIAGKTAWQMVAMASPSPGHVGNESELLEGRSVALHGVAGSSSPGKGNASAPQPVEMVNRRYRQALAQAEALRKEFRGALGRRLFFSSEAFLRWALWRQNVSIALEKSW